MRACVRAWQLFIFHSSLIKVIGGLSPSSPHVILKMKTQFLLLAIAFLCCIGHLTSRNTNKERIKREKRLKRNIDFSTNGRMQSEFYFIIYFANSLIKYEWCKGARKTRGGSTRLNTKNRVLSKPNSNTLSFIVNKHNRELKRKPIFVSSRNKIIFFCALYR